MKQILKVIDTCVIGKILSLAGTFVLVSMSAAVQATVLYVTSLEGQQIQKVDTTTSIVTVVGNTTGQPDSLIFENANSLLYTGISGGIIGRMTTTGTNTVLASGFSGPRDLALEPGGGTVLFSDFGNAAIKRLNLITNGVTTLASGANFDGVVYDNTGKLFAIRNRNSVVQLNPLTGAILLTLSTGTNLDGITFDTGNGHLWVTDFNGNVLEITTTLNLLNTFPLGFGGADGIVADGLGSLFIASRSDFSVHKFNETTHGSATVTPVINGLDDLAPVSGLGAPPNPVPEPSFIALFGLGLAGLGFSRRKKA